MSKLFSLRTLRNTIVATALAIVPAASFAGVFISVGFAPPALPVYVQPVCPGDGYLWNPGYWAYGPEGYYWVPGVWVEPPSVGVLWTPGYWGWGGSAFIFHEGYWGPHVGFYGGINYGFGFGGVGFEGGRWEGGHFMYNTAVMHVGTGFHNTYVENVHVNVNVGVHTSFNGGAGGIQARPGPQEAQFEHENHIPPTAQQTQHIQAAHLDKSNFASANGGHPTHLAATTVNNYHTTVINNHNSVNNSTHVNNSTNNSVHNNSVHNTAVANNHNTENVNNHNTNTNTETNKSVTNGNHDAQVNRPAPQQASHPAPAPAPHAAPAAHPQERSGGEERK